MSERTRPIVVLDLGDVVCRFRPDARLRALAELTRLPAAQVEAAVWGSGLDRRAEDGAIAPGDVVRVVGEALGVLVDGDAVRAAWSRAFVPDPDVLAVVDDLATAPVLFTNNGPLLSQVLEHELAPVARQFADCVCSWQVGRRKPDPRAFRALAQRLGRAPAHLVFVDDGAASVAAAAAVGLDALVFTGAGDLRRALADRGLLS